MSLHFALKVNGQSIYHAMDIVRLDHTDTPDADAVYRYRARACTENGVVPAAQYDVTVEHRYGDGAWELIRKALNAMLGDERGCACSNLATTQIYVLPDRSRHRSVMQELES